MDYYIRLKDTELYVQSIDGGRQIMMGDKDSIGSYRNRSNAEAAAEALGPPFEVVPDIRFYGIRSTRGLWSADPDSNLAEVSTGTGRWTTTNYYVAQDRKNILNNMFPGCRYQVEEVQS